MNREFIPYEQALAIKELGFDETCIMQWTYAPELIFCTTAWSHPTFKTNKESELDSKGDCISAPTFSQAFRWFREKYGLYYSVWAEFYKDGINFNWQIRWYLPKDKWTKYVISDGTMQYGDNGEYPSQEEAELECLKKLIGIVKEDKNLYH